jgi:hypothetical protein
MQKKRVLKVLRQMRKRTFMAMLLLLRIYATFSASEYISIQYIKYYDICFVIFFILKGIFLAEKRLFTDLRSFQPLTFRIEWNEMEYSILNGIFLAEKCSSMNHPLPLIPTIMFYDDMVF